jgi:hypothetical protein
MSSPMFELPKHQRIGLTVDGYGPADPPDPEFDHWGCWCPDPNCMRLDET